MTGALVLSPIPSAAGIKDKFSPLAVAAEFCALYPNRVQAILCPRGCRAWTTISKHWPMPDEAILSAVAGTEPSIYGLRWGKETRFAVLDIDKHSKYRSDIDLTKLQERLATVGLTAAVYQSSESSGWHLYIFFDDWADSGEVNEHLSTWLRHQGYEIRGGVLEVFPSGMGLRLPLQTGFAWLDQKGDLIRTREKLTKDEALASFLNDLEENKRSWSEAKDRIRSQLEVADRAKKADAQAHEKAIDTDGFERLFNYRLIPDKYDEGRRYWQSGLTGNGQRHDAILAVEHYLWHGDESAGVPAMPAEHNDEPRYKLILAWLEAKHNGFCNHINRGNWHKVEAQIKRACKWRRPFGSVQARTPYPLTERAIERLIGRSKATGRTWTMEDFKKGNDGREEEARKKIREAVQLLTDKGRRVTGRQLMRLTGCSYHTVKRHSHIWKISPVLSLPRAAGDKNPFFDLDPLGSGRTVPYGPGGSESKKSFLNPSCSRDSGDLDLVREDLILECGAPSEDPKLEQTASVPSAVAPPIPPQAAATFRFGTSSAEQPCELAPIDLGCLLPCADRQVATARESDGMETAESLASPSRTQPSTGSKHWLEGSGSTCGLNGFLPSCAEPPLGPPHLNPREIFSRGSSSVSSRMMESGQARRQGSGAVVVLATGLFVIPQTYTADSGVYGPQAGVFGIRRYQPCKTCRSVQSPIGRALRTSVYEPVQFYRQCIRVNIPQRYCLRFLVYADVRGPPLDAIGINTSSWKIGHRLWCNVSKTERRQ